MKKEKKKRTELEILQDARKNNFATQEEIDKYFFGEKKKKKKKNKKKKVDFEFEFDE